ncbi:MAG: hypothetical protein IKW68_05785 [Clostridia bacterium]|nr:hypothetical protein [Clostridia bacterium]
MKKFTAFLIAAIMVLSMIPMTAGAADESLHPIVKDVVGFDGDFAESGSCFAPDRTVARGEVAAILCRCGI